MRTPRALPASAATTARTVAIGILVGITVAGCALLFPLRLQRMSRLVSVTAPDRPDYIVEDGVMRYEIEGLRIEVEHMTDRALNEQFPVQSALGEPAITPFTFGNRIDPAMGHTPSRFTVFLVTVHNLGLAKVELRPTRCLLTTGGGRQLQAYGIPAGSVAKSLESYFRSRQGPSGNDDYIFSQTMAIVRSHSFLSDEPIHRGESYGGYIIFDPLEDDVEQVQLHIRDFVLRANAYGKPLQTIDLEFPFRREVTFEAYQAQDRQAQGPSLTRAALASPSRVVGELGNVTREAATVDAYIRTRLEELNGCFDEAFAAGTASPGEVVVNFTILAPGAVGAADIVTSSVDNDDVGDCVLARVRRWQLGPVVSLDVRPDVQDTVATSAPTQVPSTSARALATSTIRFDEVESP